LEIDYEGAASATTRGKIQMTGHLGDGARQGKSIRIEKKQVLTGRYLGPNVCRGPKANVLTVTD
jgi:hypothetical protein